MPQLLESQLWKKKLLNSLLSHDTMTVTELSGLESHAMNYLELYGMEIHVHNSSESY